MKSTKLVPVVFLLFAVCVVSAGAQQPAPINYDAVRAHIVKLTNLFNF